MYTVPITQEKDLAKLGDARAMDKERGPGYVAQYMNDKGLIVNMGLQAASIQTAIEFEDGFKGRLMQAFWHKHPASWIVYMELKAGHTPPGPDSTWLPATDGLKQSYLSALKLLAAAFPANGNGKSKASSEAQRLYEEASELAKQGGLDKITPEQLLRMRSFGQKEEAEAGKRGDDNASTTYKELAEACHAIIQEHCLS